MTEADWLAATDPTPMLEWLRRWGPVSDRKLRLFTVACGRTLPSLLAYEQLRAGLETAERYADGQANPQDMVSAAKTAERVGWSLPHEEQPLSDAVWAATAMNLWHRLLPLPRTLRAVRF